MDNTVAIGKGRLEGEVSSIGVALESVSPWTIHVKFVRCPFLNCGHKTSPLPPTNWIELGI